MNKKSKKNKTQPWTPVKMKMVEMGNALPSNITKEQRIELLKHLGKKSKQLFGVKLNEMDKWFIEYDALYLLSFCVYYFQASVEGIDKEATGEDYFHPFYIELLQALSLRTKRSDSLKPLHEESLNLWKDVRELGELSGYKHFDFPENVITDFDLNAYWIRMEMMAQTTAVRNWAYDHQMKKIAMDLCHSIDKEFELKKGFKPEVLVDVLLNITESRNTTLNIHRNKLRGFAVANNSNDAFNEYENAFPKSEKILTEEREIVWEKLNKNLTRLKHQLIAYSDYHLADIFTFSLDEIYNTLNKDSISEEKLREILDALSLEFGELENSNKEFFILDNPIHKKPLIRLGNDTYFTSISGSIPHLTLSILEDFIKTDTGLIKKYNQNKAKYLETTLNRIFTDAFPNGKVFQGSTWECPETGKVFENDLIITIEDFAIIVEAKSGSVSPYAKRGEPTRLFETLKELIEEPSLQAIRFQKYLKENNKEHHFKTRKGSTNIIDSSKIKYYIPIGVTFSHLGMISSNLKKLIDANIIQRDISELAPSFCLPDLETIFELLPLECEKIHYFSRRREFEAHVDYQGDEGDLLAFYLENGFNIGEDEYNGNIVFNLVPKSKELDPYILGIRKGFTVTKPELSMTKLWRTILTELSINRPPNWLQTSFILLNASKKDQKKFEKAMNTLKSKILTNKTSFRHNWLNFYSGPDRRKYLIIGYPYNNISETERHKTILKLISDQSEELLRGTVLIGKDCRYSDYPFDTIACSLDTNLYDDIYYNSNESKKSNPT